MLELKLTSCSFKLLILSSNYKCWILSKMNASLHSYCFMWVMNRSESEIGENNTAVFNVYHVQSEITHEMFI